MSPWSNDQAGGLSWLEADWPVPAWVRTISTTRQSGRSSGAYTSLNLAQHVGDDPQRVRDNRALLREVVQLPAEPFWLDQVHGCSVAALTEAAPGCVADAAWTDRPGRVCAVMTADCLPLLLCDLRGTEVAAVHAGWRGLCDGVIETAVARCHAPPQGLMAWLGPAIGPDAFEVGPEVRDAFLARDGSAAAAFRPGADGRWLADLFVLARQRLARAGVERVFGGGVCTYEQAELFFSYRRDGVTGRMATLIWLAE